jgi:hypothetical protein
MPSITGGAKMSNPVRWNIAGSIGITALLMFASGWRTPSQIVVHETTQAVTTYHNDNLRTGWNQNETVLTLQNVNSTSFGLQHSVTLDEQVDSQPLLVPGVNITAGQHQGKHEVVYVETENNTIYAIGTSKGEILLSQNFGTPISVAHCNSPTPTIGITSTPVIDQAAKTMYVMIYSSVAGVPTYTLHALDLGSLQDKLTPVVVQATHALTGGKKFSFNAVVQRQRPALLEANGNIYAGFGSFCDHNTRITRGWVMGWNASTLAPLANAELTDTQTPPKSTFYLSSVWMSGFGLAADASGNVYFVTGNSDHNKNTYDSETDIQESVVKLTPDLSSVSSFFTPADEFQLDQTDNDFGSGGVMLLPSQPGSIPDMAAAAGKEGDLYLLNQQALGGFDPNNKGILDEVEAGGCWCGPSYFSDSVGGHVVSSGGHTVKLWTVQTSPTVELIEAGSQVINKGHQGQDPGFFTSISSSGSSNAIIWAVSRPVSTTDTEVTLYALNAAPSNGTLPILFQAKAGSWPDLRGNANIVPTVANGRAYVASYKQLSIFGLIESAPTARTVTYAQGARDIISGSEHDIFGKITAIHGSQFTLQTRTGSLVQVDASIAIQKDLSANLTIGRAVEVRGAFDSHGVLRTTVMQRTKDSSALWPKDI